jgi:hypothetical protein
MKHLIKEKEQMILKMDGWDLQVFLGRRLYEQSIADGTFFPPYAYQ